MQFFLIWIQNVMFTFNIFYIAPKFNIIFEFEIWCPRFIFLKFKTFNISIVFWLWAVLVSHNSQPFSNFSTQFFYILSQHFSLNWKISNCDNNNQNYLLPFSQQHHYCIILNKKNNIFWISLRINLLMKTIYGMEIVDKVAVIFRPKFKINCLYSMRWSSFCMIKK